MYNILFQPGGGLPYYLQLILALQIREKKIKEGKKEREKKNRSRLAAESKPSLVEEHSRLINSADESNNLRLLLAFPSLLSLSL